MQNALARVRNPSLRQGLIFGIILGVILLALSFIYTNFYITLILVLVAAILAGLRASRETGRITTGTLAGFLTGFIGMFVPALVSIAFVLVNLDSYRKSLQTAADKLHQHVTYTNSMALTYLLYNVSFLLIIGILPGVLGGIVGGLFGSRRRLVPTPPVEEYKEATFEPPTTSEAEEAPVDSEPIDSQPVDSESVDSEPEQHSETPSKEPSSSTQQAE